MFAILVFYNREIRVENNMYEVIGEKHKIYFSAWVMDTNDNKNKLLDYWGKQILIYPII